MRRQSGVLTFGYPICDASKSIGALYGGRHSLFPSKFHSFWKIFLPLGSKIAPSGAKVRFISPSFPIWDPETRFSLVAAFLTREDKAESHPSPFQKTVERVKGRDFQKIFSRSVIPSNSKRGGFRFCRCQLPK